MVEEWRPAGGSEPVSGLMSITGQEFERLRLLILRETGICLRETKRQLLVARLTQRLRELGLESFSQYYEHVISGDGGQTELRKMINRVTTNKTSFFREPHHFDLLRACVIPPLRSRVSRDLRIWSAGCSSGEEPYSIAMTIREAERAGGPLNARILASDIDTEMLEQAESGTYRNEVLEEMDPQWRGRYFLRGYGCWSGMVRVRPELRNMITFRQINLIAPSWPLRSRFDAIFCRNVIIYFDRPTQKRVIERFAGYLKPGGYLLAGHSENLSGITGLLEPVGQTAYRLKAKGNFS
jgi:chemotaxis protein methyltransferase CheR